LKPAACSDLLSILRLAASYFVSPPFCFGIWAVVPMRQKKSSGTLFCRGCVAR